MRFYDQFGTKASDEWRAAVAGMVTKQLDGALDYLAHNPPPYAGWLPSLPEFIAIARRIHLSDPAAEKKQPVNPGTWVARSCRGLVMRWNLSVPALSKEQSETVIETVKHVAATYELKHMHEHQNYPGRDHPASREVAAAMAAELEELRRQWWPRPPAGTSNDELRGKEGSS